MTEFLAGQGEPQRTRTEETHSAGTARSSSMQFNLSGIPGKRYRKVRGNQTRQVTYQEAFSLAPGPDTLGKTQSCAL